MRWITRERPKIDRIACPWLIARFIDAAPEFMYVPKDQVLSKAAAFKAIPYDIPGVELTHEGEKCSFDAFLRVYNLTEPALHDLALIVRAADTDALHLAPQAAGLVAVSLGLSAMFQNDHEMLKHGMTVYDALYAWIRHARGEVHTWTTPPQ
ncbi:MAG: chromate resistance protein [Rhodospirillaceae bacterium]|nr:chromate resistance protein [Rhodospirillaceae bacterium]